MRLSGSWNATERCNRDLLDRSKHVYDFHPVTCRSLYAYPGMHACTDAEVYHVCTEKCVSGYSVSGHSDARIIALRSAYYASGSVHTRMAVPRHAHQDTSTRASGFLKAETRSERERERELRREECVCVGAAKCVYVLRREVLLEDTLERFIVPRVEDHLSELDAWQIQQVNTPNNAPLLTSNNLALGVRPWALGSRSWYRAVSFRAAVLCVFTAIVPLPPVCADAFHAIALFVGYVANIPEVVLSGADVGYAAAA
eukprot:2260399-Rhodomonas_salina.1